MCASFASCLSSPDSLIVFTLLSGVVSLLCIYSIEMCFILSLLSRSLSATLSELLVIFVYLLKYAFLDYVVCY